MADKPTTRRVKGRLERLVKSPRDLTMRDILVTDEVNAALESAIKSADIDDIFILMCDKAGNRDYITTMSLREAIYEISRINQYLIDKDLYPEDSEP